MSAVKVAYVLDEFPVTTQTFVAWEIEEVSRQLSVVILAMDRPGGEILHDVAGGLLSRAEVPQVPAQQQAVGRDDPAPPAPATRGERVQTGVQQAPLRSCQLVEGRERVGQGSSAAWRHARPLPFCGTSGHHDDVRVLADRNPFLAYRPRLRCVLPATPLV